MLLGKRPRPPIKRTTSMTGITVDITNVESDGPSDHHHRQQQQQQQHQSAPAAAAAPHHQMMNFGYDDNNNFMYDHQPFFAAMVSPRNNYQQQQRSTIGRSSNELIETAHFLRTCGLCNRRLAPGKDIYMYRYVSSISLPRKEYRFFPPTRFFFS